MAGPPKFHHTRVVEAAARLADEHGFANLTLAMLAADLGMRSQSLYAHIEGLQGLRDDLALMGHALLAEQLREAVMAKTGADALRSVVGALADFAAEHPGLYQASLRAPGESPELKAASARTMGPLTAVLESFGLSGDLLVHHYRAIWSGVHGFVTLKQAGLMSFSADVDDSYELMVSMFVHQVLLAGKGSP